MKDVVMRRLLVRAHRGTSLVEILVAMVINVWLVLITAGTYTYFVTRSLLTADLDESICCRVGLPEISPTRRI